jgi:FkbM family methyltransferase
MNIIRKKFNNSYAYFLLRQSIFYSIYFKYRYPIHHESIKAEDQLYANLIKKYLPKNSLIFDLGANMGQLSKVFVDCGAKTIAVEPDPTNLRHLAVIKKNNLIIEPKAISDFDGPSSFFIADNHALSSLINDTNESRKEVIVECISLKNLIAKYGKPDFIKLDIEGSEEAVLLNLDLPIKFIAYEVNRPNKSTTLINIITHLVSLSASYKFNLSQNDKSLLFEEFVEKEEIENYLVNNEVNYVMVFCLNI